MDQQSAPEIIPNDHECARTILPAFVWLLVVLNAHENRVKCIFNVAHTRVRSFLDYDDFWLTVFNRGQTID